MAGKRWTKKENEVLINNYRIETQNTVETQLPGRTWASIVIQAGKLGLSRDATHLNIAISKRNNFDNWALDKLLEETSEAYYWAGFITADGHIDTNKYRLKIALALKDITHLQKFTNFIGLKSIKIYSGVPQISVQDANIIKQFAEKFKITNNKTYNLQYLNIQDDNLFLSFLAGFIDGDGGIKKLHKRKDVHIDIVSHGSSKSVFEQWAKRLYSLFPANKTNTIITDGSMPFLDSSGYARWHISNYGIVQQIKQKIIKLNVPVMERKWNIIDLTWVSRYTIANERRQKALELRTRGIDRKEIAKELKISLSATYRYFDKDN